MKFRRFSAFPCPELAYGCSPVTPCAYADESLRRAAGGMYVVADVVVHGGHEDVRLAVRACLLRRQPRFHWRDESEAQRERMLAAFVDLSVAGRIYVHEPLERRGDVRARALCLNALLWDLWQGHVDGLVLESRQEHGDYRDRQTIAHAQRACRASPTLHYGFERPHEEPLLWLADAIAGAATASLVEGADYLKQLGDEVHRTDVRPRPL